MPAESRILVAYPGPLVRSLLGTRTDVVFLDESGFWTLERAGGDRTCVEPFVFAPDWTRASRVEDLVARLRAQMPIWVRWVAHADQYELLCREAMLYVLHVQSALTQLGIENAVFHTSASHHIDSSLLEIACAVSGVPQCFLYLNVITNRLQPLRQLDGVADRRPWPTAVSTYAAGDDIARFRSRRLQGQQPANNYAGGALQRSFAAALGDAVYVDARQRLSRLLRSARSKDARRAGRFFEQFAPLGLPEFVRMLFAQRRGLRRLERTLSRDRVEALVERQPGTVPLIAAHYQPEATSFPEGGEYDNHIDIALALRSLGHTGSILYKEHSASWNFVAHVVHQTRVGVSRSAAYFERLEQLGCVFTDPRSPVSIDRRINERLLPVTITGTIAVERSLLGFRTLVAGYPWYRGLPGAIDLRTLRSLQDVDREPAVSDGRAERAALFLDRMLSGKTILNAPGIGTGHPLDDENAVRTFTSEFTGFLEQVSAGAERAAASS